MNAPCGQPLAWHGLYKGQSVLLTPESTGHPAKMSAKLCYRIFDHLKELGLLGPDSVILDPMGGTGLTGMVAASLGLKSVLVELEPKFIGYIQANKEALEKKLGHEVNMKRPHIPAVDQGHHLPRKCRLIGGSGCKKGHPTDYEQCPLPDCEWQADNTEYKNTRERIGGKYVIRAGISSIGYHLS